MILARRDISHCRFLCSRDDSAEVDVYNPQKNGWDKISPMTQVCDTLEVLSLMA